MLSKWKLKNLEFVLFLFFLLLTTLQVLGDEALQVVDVTLAVVLSNLLAIGEDY
jgi:hypothetical protein